MQKTKRLTGQQILQLKAKLTRSSSKINQPNNNHTDQKSRSQQSQQSPNKLKKDNHLNLGSQELPKQTKNSKQPDQEDQPTIQIKNINLLVKNYDDISEMSSQEMKEGQRLFDEISISSNSEGQKQQEKQKENKNSEGQKEQEKQKENNKSKPIEQMIEKKAQKQHQTKLKSILKTQKNKKNKNVTFNQNIMNVQALYFNPNRKWKQQIMNQKKGKFSVQQYQKLIKSMDTYARINNISFEELTQSVSLMSEEKRSQKSKKMWTNICSVLQNRSLISSFKFLRRMLHKDNHQGQWTQQDIKKLQQLVEKEGRKWKQIGKVLGRTAQNVRDKYRQLGQQNIQNLQTFWTIEEIISLLIIIDSTAPNKFLNPDIKLQLDSATYHNQMQKTQLTSKSYNSKKFLFHNLQVVSKYINNAQFQKLNTANIQWGQITKSLSTKSILQCRNKFIQIMNINFKRNSMPISQDQYLVKFLLGQNVQSEGQIDWKKWDHQSFTSNQAINRWRILKKHVEGRKTKSLQEIIELLKLQFQHLGSQK